MGQKLPSTLIASLAGALLSQAIFSGCQRSSYYSILRSSGIQLASGGAGTGGGYEGGIARYVYLDPAHACASLGADAKPLPNSEIDIIGSGNGRVIELVRSGCSDIAPPLILSAPAIQFVTDGSGDLIYQGNLYVPAPMTAFYVSPSGNDANPGTASAPFAGLARAQQAMQNSAVKTTYLRAGIYNLGSTLTLTSSDNGETWSYYPPDGVSSAALDGGGSVTLIYIHGGSNITINGLKLQNFSAFGVWGAGGQTDTGPAPIASGNTVENCDVGFNAINSFNSGCIYFFSASPNTTIRNNYCHDVGSQGIGINTWNSPADSIDGGLIENNYIERAVGRLGNGGAIYVAMRWGGANHLTIRNNFIREYGGPGVNDAFGISVADNASNVTVQGNIIGPPGSAAAGTSAFAITNGHDNHITGNIVDLGNTGVDIVASWNHMASEPVDQGMAGNTFTGNAVISGFSGSQNTSFFSASGFSYYQNEGGLNAPTIQDNAYWNYAGGQVRSDGNIASDSNPILKDPQISGWTYQIAPGSPAINAPMSMPAIVGGWGPPGFVIPQSGPAPSSPH